MKYGYLKRHLCILLSASLICSAGVPAFAEDLISDGAESAVETPVPVQPTPEVPQETVEPTVAPAEPVVVPDTPAPEVPQEPAEPTAAPDIPVPDIDEPVVDWDISDNAGVESPAEWQDPDSPANTNTPTPEPSATETPTPAPTATPKPTATPIPEKVKWIIDEIDKLNKLPEIKLEHKDRIEKVRDEYDKLSGEDKKLIKNYKEFVAIEETLNRLIKEDEEKKEEESLYVSNIRAGKEFYISSLKSKYHLTLSQDLGKVMDEIEAEYKEANGIAKAGEGENTVTTSGNTLLVRNWQDILAIYLYKQHKKGVEEFTVDASAKGELAEIFAEMNPVVRNKINISKFSYGNRHIDYYIRNNKLSAEDRDFLYRYVETDCKLLCAVTTAAKGFVRQSVGDDVSEERVNVITAAYSLIGKVGYFWGGKSDVIGEDPRWGSPAMVVADGSRTTGTVRAYGLDCSGFVTWSVLNGYRNLGMLAYIGHGTSVQWYHANVVSAEDAQPGDLVFAKGPENGSDNHVGILCGQTSGGDWLAVHCTSSKNGVTVGEAYSASFRYIRQPAFYPTDAQVEAMIRSELTDGIGDSDGAGQSISVSRIGYLDDLISGGSELADGSGSDDVLIDDSEVEPF